MTEQTGGATGPLDLSSDDLAKLTTQAPEYEDIQYTDDGPYNTGLAPDEAPLTDEELVEPGLQEALVAEIQDLAKLSIHYKNERDTAKTETKRKHFDKKLTRNNETAHDLLIALQRILDAKDRKDAASKDLIETNDGEFISPDQIVAE